MKKSILNLAIAFVWIVNGLYCKLLNFVPRHQQIVARILGEEHAFLFTKIIGVLEIMMAIWVLSKIRPRWCAVFQMTVVATMNSIEFILARDLLLFGWVNALIATAFVSLLYFKEFVWFRHNSVIPD